LDDPKGRFGSGPLRIWDVASGHERFACAHGWKAIETVCFSPDSNLLAAHEQEGDLKLWDTRTGEEKASFRPVTQCSNWVHYQFSPDGRYLVFQDRSKDWPDKDHITFWNIAYKREQGTIESYFDPVYSPDGQTFATIRGQGKDLPRAYDVLLWKMDHVPRLLEQHRITAGHVAVSSDLHTFATADDLPGGIGRVELWDMETGNRRWSGKFNQHGTHLQELSFVGGDKVLSARGGGGTSRYDWRWQTTLWDVIATPKRIGSFSETPVVSPDGEWLAIPMDGGAMLEKVSGTEQRKALIGNGDDAPKLIITNWKVYPNPHFSPDSKMLIVEGLSQEWRKPFLGDLLPERFNPFRGTPGGPIVRVWDVSGHHQLLALPNCSQAWVSPDSSTLASLREGQFLDLWKPPFRNPTWRVVGWAINCWLLIVLVCWLAVKSCKQVYSVYRRR
jgi:WD40 repeat protein